MKQYKTISRIAMFAVLMILATGAARADRWSKDLLPVGTEAPEFSLPRLKITTDEEGAQTGSVTEETVALSSLTNNPVVVLFFSSYT